MSNCIKHAKEEFRVAGWMNEDGSYTDEMQGMMCDHILRLLEVFADEGHSGFSANYAIDLFTRLAKFEQITPLTGNDDEWNDCGDFYQNKRNSAVFKDKDTGYAYYLDGIVFWDWYHNAEEDTWHKSYYTSRNSRVPVVFPWTKPETIYQYAGPEGEEFAH